MLVPQAKLPLLFVQFTPYRANCIIPNFDKHQNLIIMRAQITPFLLFKDEAEAAANFYVSVFNGRLLNIDPYPEGTPIPKGAVMTASFEIFGMTMTALNWGMDANYTESISFAIEPESQEETDHYWNALIANGGSEGPCGWCKDKFGVSWQVAPTVLVRYMSDPDPKKSSAVMKAMMKMKKIIIKDIEGAYKSA
jgi:predicted 3-demethylubiquinone-9 3-methyltransferase (glyoxalase superfamily)